jgi:hypothetical protein
MQEISSVKQKILIWGLGGVLILAVVMIGVMFMGQKNRGKQVVDNTDQIDGVKANGEKDKNKKAGTEDSNNGKVAEGVKRDGKFLKIAKDDVYGLKMKKGTNQIMFYQQQKVLSADPFSGQKHALGSYPFIDISEFLWARDNSKIIVKDSGDYYVYDINKNLANKFRYEIDNAIWNRNGDKIIYKYYNSSNGQRIIKIADIDGENGQLIVDNIPYRNLEITLQPNSDRVCYFPKPDARAKGKLFCFNLNGQDKKEYGGQYGQDYLWSPDGKKILTSFTMEDSGDKLVLGVMNEFGGEAKGLSMATTVKKCVWSKNSVDVYCATLAGQPLAVMLPNAWDEEIFNSADTFWKINTETGKKERLVDLEAMNILIDSENLILDAEENFLFFVSRRDRGLWRLEM